MSMTKLKTAPTPLSHAELMERLANDDFKTALKQWDRAKSKSLVHADNPAARRLVDSADKTCAMVTAYLSTTLPLAVKSRGVIRRVREKAYGTPEQVKARHKCIWEQYQPLKAKGFKDSDIAMRIKGAGQKFMSARTLSRVIARFAIRG